MEINSKKTLLNLLLIFLFILRISQLIVEEEKIERERDRKKIGFHFHLAVKRFFFRFHEEHCACADFFHFL